MSLLFNNNEISSLYYNGQEVNSVHLNGQEVWTSNLEAGLYGADGKMTYTWQELLDAGYLVESSGTLTKGTNTAANMIGKLVISDTITTINGGSSSTGVFNTCSKLTEVHLPDSVTSIGGYGFANCTGLTKVKMSKNLKTIGTYGFYKDSALLEITIPETVTSIGTYAFYQCSKVTKIKFNAISMNNLSDGNYTFCETGNSGTGVEVIFGNKVKHIPAYLFFPKYERNRPKIISIVFGKSVETVGSSPFAYATALKSLTLSGNISSIGSPFSSLSSLTYLNFDGTLAQYAQMDWGSNTTPLNYTKELHLNGELVTKAIIEEGATKIGKYAFYGCTSITEISIPSTVTTVEYNAFGYCSNVSKFYFNAINAKGSTSACSGTGSSAESLELIIGDAVDCIPALGLTNTTSVKMGKNVTILGENAFYNYTKLTKLDLPRGLTTLSNKCFYGCTGLTSIFIPNSMTTVTSTSASYSPFYGCTGLKIYCEASAKQSGWGSYWNYYSDYYTLGATYSYLFPEYDFAIAGNKENYNKLNGYYYYSDEDYNILLGVDDTNIENIEIPTQTTRICSNAFKDCVNVTEITIPENINYIGADAFSNCTGVTQLNFNALKMSDLTQTSFAGIGTSGVGLIINIGPEVISLPKNCFYNCSNVTQVKFKNTGKCETIGMSAFAYCKGLKTFIFPASVKKINSLAISYCTGLTAVYVPASVETIVASSYSGSIVYGCSSLNMYLEPASRPSGWSSEFMRKSSVGNFPNTWGYSLSDFVINFCPDDLETTNINGINYFVENENSYIAVNRADENLTELNLDTKTVRILKEAFKGLTNVTSVTIPENVTQIDVGAFRDCPEISEINYNAGNVTEFNSVFANSGSSSVEVNFGDSIISVPKNFLNNSTAKVSSVNWGNNITTIGDYAFYNCYEIKSLEVPSSITSIGQYAFYGSKLTNLIYSNGTIGNYAFQNSAISVLNLGSGVTSIGNYAFSGNKMTALSVPGGTIGSYAFYNCPITSLSLSKSVNSIGSYAFQGTKMTSLTVPNGSIGTGAFYNCPIETLNLEEGVTSIGQYAFHNIYIKSLNIPSSVTNIYKGAFRYCSYRLNSITVSAGNANYYVSGNCLIETSTKYLHLGCENSTIPSDVVTLGYYAFYNCSEMSGITIPSSVTKIDDYCFYRAFNGTTQLSIPGTCKTIGDSAFASDGSTNVGIAKLTLNSGITTIGPQAFYYNYQLSSGVTIPSSVTEIGHSTFAQCHNLPSINVQAAVTIPANFCEDCSSLTSLTLVSGCTGIEYEAFSWCQNLKTVSVPSGNNIAFINSGAFYDCYALESFAFIANCTKLTKIEYEAFYNVSRPNSLTIPDSVTQVGDLAFNALFSYYGDGALVLGTGLTSFGAYAFGVEAYFCKTITFRNTSYTWNAGGNTVNVSNATTNVEHFANYNNAAWTRNG